MTVRDVDLRSAYQRAVRQRSATEREACPPVEEIDALASGAGAETARRATLDHVMACPACERDFELLRAIHSAGRSRRSVAVPRWYAIAAAVVVVAGVSVFLARERGAAPVMRGTPSASGVPELVAPRGDVAASAARRFVWGSLPNAARYTIELLESGGQVRAAAIVTDTVWQLPDSVQLTRGDQLEWWVRAELADGREERSTLARVRVR